MENLFELFLAASGAPVLGYFVFIKDLRLAQQCRPFWCLYP